MASPLLRSPSPRTPQEVPNNLLRGGIVGQSSRRYSRELSFSSPRKKSGKTVMSVEESIENCHDELSDVIKDHRKAGGHRSSDDDEMARVHQILKEDGLSESDVVYAQICCLCTQRPHRKTFLLLQTREGRLNWAKVAWELRCCLVKKKRREREW